MGTATRFIRTTVGVLGASALLASTVIVVSPTGARAAELPGTLAEANAQIDGNLGSLNSQAGELGGQIGAVNGTIGQLETEQAALRPVIEHKRALLRQTIRESYIAGDPSSVEVIASNHTFSGVVGQQTYRDSVSEKSKKAAEELAVVQAQLDGKIAEAEEKRDGLVALKGQLDEKIATAESQAQAKAALAEATQNKEEEYQKLLAAERQSQAAAALAPAPSSAPASSPAPQPFRGGRGGNPYPWGQCTWYVYDQTGRGQNGNAGSWRPSSSTPGVGKIMIWGAGEQGAGGAGHVGVVIGVSGNTVTIRHMNWSGYGQVSTGTFRSTGKFY